MLELILVILVGLSSLWVAFEVSKASISLQISSPGTDSKEKQSEEFLASLALKTPAWWEEFLIAFKTGLSVKFGTVNFKNLYNFLKMILEFFKYIFHFCYNLASVNVSYSPIFDIVVSKIW